jgi:EmrB/QacA subfamily drug resistance transporter
MLPAPGLGRGVGPPGGSARDRGPFERHAGGYHPPVPAATVIHARWILTAVILASGIVFLDSTIVNVALPRIGQDLPATLLGTLEGQAYVTSGYLAMLSASLILAGAAADRYGRRRVFLIGLVSFGATSALCGLAPTMELLVVSRLLQGCAGALLVPGPLSIITATFEGTARAHAIGLWSAATAALTILGPLAGGIVVDSLSWRLAFLVNVPLVLVALYAAIRYVPESRNEDAPRRLDWLGSAVIAIAVGGISFGLIRGQEQRWSDPSALVILGIGIAAAVAFPVLMLKRPDPLVPPALFRIRAFTTLNISTFLIYGAVYTSSLLQSLFLQGALGYTALGAAAISLPTGILLTLFSTRVGVLAARLGAWPFLVVGPLLMAAAFAWFARIPSTSQPWRPDLGAGGLTWPPASTLTDVLPSTLLLGVGFTLVVAPLTTTLMGSIPVGNAGLGSAINNAVSRVGQPLLLAVIYLGVSAVFYGVLESLVPALDTGADAVREAIQPLNPAPAGTDPVTATAVREASTDAFRLAMLIDASLLVAGALVNGFGLHRRRAQAPPAQSGAAT